MNSYEADAQLVARNRARLERVQDRLQELKRQWQSIDVQMESANGDVALSVNHMGRLMTLSLAPGCTTRYTNQALEKLITSTLEAAVTEAYGERTQIENDADEAARLIGQLFDD